MSRQTILLTLTFYRRWRLLGRHPSRTRCIRDCTGVMLDQMRLRWRTIGIHVRHGWPCSKIFVITIRFGGEFLARGRVILKLITITVGPIHRERPRLQSSTALFRSGIWIKFMIFLHARSGVGLTVRPRYHLFSFLLKKVVSDSLLYQPELATVIATYKRLVVGVAILSSPWETYITYLAVKPGWDNSQIATCGWCP